MNKKKVEAMFYSAWEQYLRYDLDGIPRNYVT